MRVLMVNKYYHMVGGVERYVTELTRLLEQQGHEVIPFAMSDPRNEPSPYAGYFVSGMDFFDQGKRPPLWAVAERVVYSREARRKIDQLVTAVRPDVAHLHNIYHYISPSILDALHTARVPVVMTLHDYKLICPVYSLWANGQICERCRGGRFISCARYRCNHGSLPASLLNTIEAYAHRAMRIYDKVDLLISPSQFLMDKHVEHGLGAARLAVLNNFLLLDEYQPRFNHDGYYAYVGRLTSFKGVGTLLRAAAAMGAETPLLIVGDGPARPELEAVARQEGANVRFMGHQSGDALQDLIRGAMFIVVPSEWYENCPYAVLEAFALGKPVVASAVGGIPELVEDGVNGALFEMGSVSDLVEKLWAMLTLSPAALRALGQAGRVKIERHYNAPGHYAALNALYRQVHSPSLLLKEY